MWQGTKLFSWISLLFVIVYSSRVYGQAEVALPRMSPSARVTFSIGFTEIDISYSSPAVRNRAVWGNIVPYNQLWRAGANEATVITFSEDVKINDQLLAAGSYSFFVIPHRDGFWTAIFNSDVDQWGVRRYDESKDVLRVKAPVDTLCDREERLHYYISDNSLDEGSLCLRWEHRQMCLNVTTFLEERLREKISEANSELPPANTWMTFAEVAEFLSSSPRYLDWALSFALESTARYDACRNWWIRAQIEARKGDYPTAIRSATRSLDSGKSTSDDIFYNNQQQIIREQISEWSRHTKS